MPQRALAVDIPPPELDENGCIPIIDPEDGAFLGAVAPTEELRRLGACVETDPAEPIALFDGVTRQPAGAIERPAFPANLPDDHPDPDATVAYIQSVGILPANRGLVVNLNLNPYNLLSNAGVEQQAHWNQWSVVFRDTTAGTTARMWGNTVPTSTADLNVWNTWNSTTATTTVTIDNYVWNQWLTTTQTTRARTPLVAGTGFYAPPLTPEQQAEREVRRLAAEEQAQRERVRYAEMERERDEATARATELLRDVLDEEQEAELITHARFHVRSQKGKLYRIRRGWSHSVDLIEDGKIAGTYCIHPREAIPTEDSMLAQKLMLENAEDEFLRIANYSRAYGERLA